VKGALGTIGAQTILNQCLNTGSADFCNLIRRGPAGGPQAGSLWISGPTGSIADTGYVNNQITNTGSLKVGGIDMNGDYRTTLGNSKLRWQFTGTVLNKYVVQPFTGGFDYNCAGFYGSQCGTPTPKFRFNTNLKFTLPNNFALTGRWRYFGAVTLDNLSADPDLADPGSAPTRDEHIKAQNYFDLLFTVPIKDTITLRMGVNNVLDKRPPVVSSVSGSANGNTFPGTYDHLGRSVFANLTADF
jgi:iron complex outermembrane recepter protein